MVIIITDSERDTKSNTNLEMWMIKTYLDFLEGAVEHGDEHIQQDDHHDDVVHPVQDVADVLNELVVNVNNH